MSVQVSLLNAMRLVEWNGRARQQKRFGEADTKRYRWQYSAFECLVSYAEWDPRVSKRPIVFEFSRYVDFFFQPGPSGIARIDIAFARYLADQPDRLAGVIHHRFAIRTLATASTLRRLIGNLERNWNENDHDDVGKEVETWLLGIEPTRRRVSGRLPAQGGGWRKVFNLVTGWPWHNIALRIPPNAIYLNTDYSNTDRPDRFAWLEKRPDITPVFVLYDLIPLERPEFFWNSSDTTFPIRLKTILKFARVVIVTAHEVAEKLAHYANEHGREDLRIAVIPLPPPEIFLSSAPVDERQPSIPSYFVVCGTIEPRKNHLLLLNIWQRMAISGGSIPKLVIVGHRGWKNESVLDFIERNPAIKGHVLEVSDLSTSDLKRIVSGARALLMPSYAEGFGLPVAEALAVGTPVIASDIPVLREAGQDCAIYIDPMDGLCWERTIRQLASDDAVFFAARRKAEVFRPFTWQDFFRNFEDLIEDRS